MTTLLNEYENLLNSFEDMVRSELLPYTRCLLLYGSYLRERKEPGWVLPGQSDIDLVLIIDTGDPRPSEPLKRLKEISEAVVRFMADPIYFSILDLTMLEYKELPPSVCSSFNPLHLMNASQGDLLVGKNVLSTVEFSDKVLKRTAKVAAYSVYETMRNSYLRRPLIGEMDLAFIGVDSVLEIAHTLLSFLGHFNLVRTEIPEKFDEILGDKFGILSETVQEAQKFRLGIQKKSNREFGDMALKFCQESINFLRSPL